MRNKVLVMDMRKMREHNSQPERGSPERGATLLEVGLATALIAIALVGLSQIYASRNEFRQDQAESDFLHILAKQVEMRLPVSELIADLSEGESRIFNRAGLLEAGLINGLEKTSFHIQGEEMEAILFVVKGKGSSFRMHFGLVQGSDGSWTLNDEKAEALQRFLRLASLEGGYFRRASGAGGLHAMMNPDRAMTAADRTRPLWLDYADALSDQKALSDSTIPITELETGRYSEAKILALLSGMEISALEGGRSVRLRGDAVITGNKNTKRITGSYTGTGQWLNPFKMPLSYNLAKRLAEGWKLELMGEGDTVEDLSVNPVTCSEDERAVAIAAPKDLYANFLGDSGKSATKKLAGGETSVESDLFQPTNYNWRCDAGTRFSDPSYCESHGSRRLTSGVAGYEETSTNLFEMQRTFPDEMFDAASMADLSEAEKATLRRQLEERWSVDYAHRPYGTYAHNGFTASQEGFQRNIDGSQSARHGAGTSTPELERTITASSPLRLNGVIRLSDGSYVAGKGASTDLAENGDLNLGLVYDKARLSDAQAEALLAKLQDKEGFIKRIWKNLDERRTDRMTARYQDKYKYWCHSYRAIGLPSDICNRLAETLGGSHASYVASINNIISEIEAARLAYTDTVQAQLAALESSNIYGGRIFKQSGRFYFNRRNRPLPLNLPIRGHRLYKRVLAADEAMSASDSRTGEWLIARMCDSAHAGTWSYGFRRPEQYDDSCGNRDAFTLMAGSIKREAFPFDGLTEQKIATIKNRPHQFNMHNNQGGWVAVVGDSKPLSVQGYFFPTRATIAQLNQMVADQNSITSAYDTTKTRLGTMKANAQLDVNLAKLRETRDNRWHVSRLLDQTLFHKLALEALRQDPALASAFEEEAVHMASGASEPKLTALHALGETEGDATSVARPRHVIPVALNHFKRQMKCDALGRCSYLNQGTGPGQFRPGHGIHEEGRAQWGCVQVGAPYWECSRTNLQHIVHSVARPGHGGRSHTAGMEVIYPDDLIHKKAVCVPVAPAAAP